MAAQPHDSSRRRGLWFTFATLAALSVLGAAGCGSSSSSSSSSSASTARRTAPPRGYVNPKQVKNSPNTVYNHCEANVVNGDYNSIKLASSEKYGPDDWVQYRGPQDIRPKGQLYITMTTESGFARGCWWRAKWSDGNGSISVYVSDPYNGHNEYSCTTTGRYHCYRREGQSGFIPNEELSGDYLRVNYIVLTRECRDRREADCGGGAPSKYP